MANKMKTKRAAAKRFKLTASGKIKFKRANLRHILTKKDTSYKRAKRKAAYVATSDMSNVLKCLALK
ncbi:MAG: 50S ribosomal protein L35 [Halobacteriovoraceae bacterium]|nr:50S ribosomal protein L35 [Halobacteriovoraceae bacterium]MCB9095077.1 50S ribosomal protein L35 [Halobacteriovoraceae bacterium]